MDFLTSIGIFVFFLIIIFSAYSSVFSGTKSIVERNQLISRTAYLAEMLVSSEGIPADWSALRVSSIGFKSKKGFLNNSKILEFLKIDYERTKMLLRIQDYDFFISVKDRFGKVFSTGIARNEIAYFSDGNLYLASLLSGRNLSWDFYYAGTVKPDLLDCRNYYSDSKEVLFNKLLQNSSSYASIVLESPSLNESQINLTALKNFVKRGGILVFAGKGSSGELLIKDFNMTSVPVSNSSSLIVSPDYVLLNGSVGKAISFNSVSYAFRREEGNNYLNIVAGNQTHAYIAYWDYGLGRIYYFTGILGNIEGGYSLLSSINLGGNALVYGSYPTSHELAVSIRRLSLIDSIFGKEPVSLNIVLWK